MYYNAKRNVGTMEYIWGPLGLNRPETDGDLFEAFEYFAAILGINNYQPAGLEAHQLFGALGLNAPVSQDEAVDFANFIRTVAQQIQGGAEEEEEEEEKEYDEKDEEEEKKLKLRRNKKNRDMKKCFTNGQCIRHKIGNDIWYGTYNSLTNKIVRGSEIYDSLSGFGTAHYKNKRPNRAPNNNGWAECECEVNGKWLSYK